MEWIKAFEARVKKVEIVPLSFQSPSHVPCPTSHVPSTHDQTTGLKLLYIGRLHPLKGVEYLLEAMPTDCKLVIIGKDEGEGKKLKKIAARRGLDVEFRGIVSEAEKEAAYQWCDALVLPTLSENFGLVIAEALERGKRVITTDGAPAWEPKEYETVELWKYGNMKIWKCMGGRLLYLKGYRDGAPEERVQLLKKAIVELACQF